MIPTSEQCAGHARSSNRAPQDGSITHGDGARTLRPGPPPGHGPAGCPAVLPAAADRDAVRAALAVTGCHGPGCYAAQPGGEGWPEPGLLYAACQRVLRPGGILGVITAGPPTRTVNSPACPATWGPAPAPPGSSAPSTSSWCMPPSATASLIPAPLPSPSACQAAAESAPTCSSLSSPEDRYDQPPPGTRPRVPAAPGRRHLCVAGRAPIRSSSEPGSALRSPVTTGVAELTELLCYQPASRPDTSMPN